MTWLRRIFTILIRRPSTRPRAKDLLISLICAFLHIYHIDDALRCVIIERAIAMRRSLETELGWGSFFFWSGPQKYSIPTKEGDCVGRYREWSKRGTAENIIKRYWGAALMA